MEPRDPALPAIASERCSHCNPFFHFPSKPNAAAIAVPGRFLRPKVISAICVPNGSSGAVRTAPESAARGGGGKCGDRLTLPVRGIGSCRSGPTTVQRFSVRPTAVKKECMAKVDMSSQSAGIGEPIWRVCSAGPDADGPHRRACQHTRIWEVGAESSDRGQPPARPSPIAVPWYPMDPFRMRLQLGAHFAQRVE